MLLHSIQHGPNQAIYAAIKLIEEAKDTILLSTFVLEGQGHAGVCLLDALRTSKAKKIKFLTNHYCLFSQKTLAYLQTFPCLIDSSRKKFKLKVWKHFFANSNHAKFIVADGIKCSLGGYNFQESFFMDDEGAWNDLGIIVSSVELATNLKKYFKTLWKDAHKVDCNIEDFQMLQRPTVTCPVKSRGKTLDIETYIEHFDILTQLPKRLFLHQNKSQAHKSIMATLELATQTIDILSPNVVDLCIWKLLFKKMDDGVCVRILTNYGHNHSQSYLILLEKETNYFCKQTKSNGDLLEIRYVNGTTSNKKKYLETDNRQWPLFIDHSKFFNVDRNNFYIGSFNMDAVSLHACGEAGVIIHDESLISEKINAFLFEPIWKKATPLICGGDA